MAARQGSSVPLLPSLLDRLFDDRPDQPAEAERGQSLSDAKRSLGRDLSRLLNTRETVSGDLAAWPEARRSVAAYGLPDLTSLSPKSGRDVQTLHAALETVIRTFEPRLAAVMVEQRPVDDLSPRLHFRVSAMMRARPKPVGVAFDTVLDPEKKAFLVKDEG